MRLKTIDFDWTKAQKDRRFYQAPPTTSYQNIEAVQMAHLLMILDGLGKATQQIVGVAEIATRSPLSSSIGYLSHEF